MAKESYVTPRTGRYGTLCDAPYGTLRDATETYFDAPYGTIQDPTGPYGTLRDATGRHGTLEGYVRDVADQL